MALHWAVSMRMAPAVFAIEMLKLPKKGIEGYLKESDYPALLAACPDDFWRLWLKLAWHTGMRLGETFELRWQKGSGPWLDFDSSRVRFPAEYCKGRKDDWLPLHSALIPDLQAAKGTGRAFERYSSSGSMGRAFSIIARPWELTAHDVRRGFGTRYAPKVPAHILQRLMRHANIQTTLRYYADLDPALDAAIGMA